MIEKNTFEPAPLKKGWHCCALCY